MPTPTTTEEFLDLLRKSGVVEENRLTAWLDKARGEGLYPAEPQKLAETMLRQGLLTDFQAEQLLQGKWRRFSIGKYKVLERLGAGGMGSVFLCEHKLMRRRVAVKVLPTGPAQDASALERFQREAQVIASLDHPNIVRAYDIDQDEDLHYLVMEYVDGASLQDLIRRAGPLSPVRAAHYIRQAAIGLQHAHETKNIVHRDIKPGNVLVDRLGTVKILDMGLARFFHDDKDNITQKYDESVLGTADYLAPEQALDSHAVDIRADIYSLGATMYYCLTGKTPFPDGSVAQKLIWQQTRQPKSVTSFRSDVPAELLAVMDKMMAKDPAQRYQRPDEVAAALDPFTATPIEPPPEAEMPYLSPALRLPENPATVEKPRPKPAPAAAASTPAPTKTAPARAATPTPAKSAPARAIAPAVKNGQPSPKPKPAPAPRPTVATPKPKPVAERKTVAVSKKVVEVDRSDALAPETDPGLSRQDTKPRSKKRKKKKKPVTLGDRLRVSWEENHFAWIAGLTGLFAVSVLLAVWAFLFLS